jgi:hypothetical protein
MVAVMTDTSTPTVTPQILADKMWHYLVPEFGAHLRAIASFEALHDVCDANEYVASAAEEVGFDWRAVDMDDGHDLAILNAAVALVDAKLRASFDPTRLPCPKWDAVERMSGIVAFCTCRDDEADYAVCPWCGE